MESVGPHGNELFGILGRQLHLPPDPVVLVHHEVAKRIRQSLLFGLIHGEQSQLFPQLDQVILLGGHHDEQAVGAKYAPHLDSIAGSEDVE